MDETESSASTLLEFGEFRFDRGGGGLRRRAGDGTFVPVRIGSRANDVLATLISRPGDLVSKQEIMDAVWPATVVEDSNLTVQISALRRVLDAGRRGESCIETVAGRGYRFIEPVTPVTQLQLDPVLPVAAKPMLTPKPGRRLWPVLALIALAVLMLGGTTWYLNRPDGAQRPPRLSIVVLPFKSQSPDHSDDYLADAITDALTTDLSHIPQTFVIAPASARAASARSFDTRKIGRELGVRYAIEGSARRSGSLMRVNVQLASTETGEELWADRFDYDLFDPLSGEDQILARMRGKLGFSLVDIETGRSRRERPNNPDVFDLIMRARWWSNQPPSQRRMEEAEALYEQALRLDPGSVIAMTGLANVLSERNMNWAGQWLSAETEQRVAKMVTDALVLAPMSELALVAHVRLMHGQARFKELLQPSQQLVELYPNNPEGYHHLARAMQFEGRFQDAIALFDKAIRLDPLEPRIFQRYGFMAFSMMMAGRYSDSAEWFARSLAANPEAPPPLLARRYQNMSAALALAGKVKEARAAAQQAEEIWPFDTVRSHYPLDLRSPALIAHEEVFRRGLSLAGVRDHAEEEADFGVPSDNVLHANLAGRTPTTVPGAATITTAALSRLLATDQKPVLLDPAMHWWGRSLPGAVGLKGAGLGGMLDDPLQERLRRTLLVLANGDYARPIVAIGWNSERFDGRNLALRLVALGYTNVYWYRGGREAWEVAGLPEVAVSLRDW